MVLVGDTPEELDNILIADGYTYLLEATVAPPAPLIPVTGRPITDIPPIRREELTAPIRGIDLTPNWITRISPDDYAKFWSSYSNVVICEDNYQLGLLASVYASYLNAPLFFEGRVPSDVSLARRGLSQLEELRIQAQKHTRLNSLNKSLQGIILQTRLFL